MKGCARFDSAEGRTVGMPKTNRKTKTDTRNVTVKILYLRTSNVPEQCKVWVLGSRSIWVHILPLNYGGMELHLPLSSEEPEA